MNAFVPYLAALHQQDLLEQAQVYRRGKLSTASRQSTPAWRRTLSGALASAARRLDPSLEVERSAALPAGRGADLQPAC
jgi:hypothetical protein